MNAADFVNAVRIEVQDSATQDVMSLLEQPPGRRPEPDLVALSRWFNDLSVDNKQRIREVVAMASHQATFGALTVLDGVRVIEDGFERGRLELRHVKGKETTLLNDPNGPLLHDLLNQT